LVLSHIGLASCGKKATPSATPADSLILSRRKKLSLAFPQPARRVSKRIQKHYVANGSVGTPLFISTFFAPFRTLAGSSAATEPSGSAGFHRSAESCPVLPPARKPHILPSQSVFWETLT